MSIPGSASPLFLSAAAAAAPSAFRIDRSLRFNSGDSSYLDFQPSSAGNRKTWTWSSWVKTHGVDSRKAVFGTYASGICQFRYMDNGRVVFQLYDGTGYGFETSRVFRDPSAWHHIVLSVDTTLSTSGDRIKFYVNGSLVSSAEYVSFTAPPQNFETVWNNNALMNIGRTGETGYQYDFDGYLADVHFIDGQALAPTDFGEYDDNNVWQPKAYSGSYGTNGFRLSFSDNTSTTTIAEDSSGNNNDWTANNLSVASGSGNDSLIDTPTNYEASSGNNGGNYATLNPLDSPLNNFGTPSNGNLDFQGSSNAYHSLRATISIPSTGKWYYESTFNGTAYSPRASDSQYSGVGFVKTNVEISSVTDGNSNWLGDSGYGLNFSGTRTEFHNAAIDGGDVVGVAINRDANTFEYFVNGTSVETGTIGVASGTDLSPFVFVYGSSYTTHVLNFGQRPFAYTPPTGYLSHSARRI